MKVLLIGGTGVLSSAVAETAAARGDSVTVINRGSRPVAKGCELIISDRHNWEEITRNIQGRTFDVVIDFLVFNRDDSVLSFEFWKNRCKHYILISSCFVYDFSKGGVMREDSPRGLSCWKYSIGKCEAEDSLVSMAAKSFSCKYTIVRPFVTYGNTRIPYSLAPAHGCDWTMIFRAKAGKPIISWAGCSGRCNIMRVEDFCTGLLGLMKNSRAYGEAVNVCGDETPCWRDVISAVESATGIEIPLLDLPKEFIKAHYPQRSEEIDGRSYEISASNEKLKQLVPMFQTTISLQEGIAKTVTAYLEKNFQNGVDWDYDGRCDEVVNLWYKSNGIQKKCRYVDYLSSGDLGNYLKYRRASLNQQLVSRLLRKCINVGLKCVEGCR